MRFLETVVKDWLKTRPSYDDKVKAVRDLMDYQVKIIESMPVEHQERFRKLIEQRDSPEVIQLRHSL